MYLPTEFPELLAYHLKNRGLTQRDFADKCGFSTGLPGNLVNGARTPPLDKLDVMAKALDLNNIERASFIESAHLAHCPQFIRDRLTQLRVQLSQVRDQHALILQELQRLGIKFPNAPR